MKKQFFKDHLITKKTCNVFINKVIQGKFCFYFNKRARLSYPQYKALMFFCRKKLKFFSKLFIRLTPKLKNTSKAIGMGKGKGSLNEIYFPIQEGQIFCEFGFKKGMNAVINNEYTILNC